MVEQSEHLAARQVVEYPSLETLEQMLALRSCRKDCVDSDTIPRKQVLPVGRSTLWDDLPNDV